MPGKRRATPADLRADKFARARPGTDPGTAADRLYRRLGWRLGWQDMGRDESREVILERALQATGAHFTSNRKAHFATIAGHVVFPPFPAARLDLDIRVNLFAKRT